MRAEQCRCLFTNSARLTQFRKEPVDGVAHLPRGLAKGRGVGPGRHDVAASHVVVALELRAKGVFVELVSITVSANTMPSGSIALDRRATSRRLGAAGT